MEMRKKNIDLSEDDLISNCPISCLHTYRFARGKKKNFLLISLNEHTTALFLDLSTCCFATSELSCCSPTQSQRHYAIAQQSTSVFLPIARAHGRIPGRFVARFSLCVCLRKKKERKPRERQILRSVSFIHSQFSLSLAVSTPENKKKKIRAARFVQPIKSPGTIDHR